MYLNAKIENYFSFPLDIEFCMNNENKLQYHLLIYYEDCLFLIY